MRIRTVKPEFWQHEGLAALPEFTRLLAIALLNWSDDEGYFYASPNLIRGALFPFVESSSKIPRALDELSSVGWIELGGDTQKRSVGRIINFDKHQRVDRPQASKIKPSSTFDEFSTNDRRMIDEPSTEEGKGMEQGTGKGKGKEGASLPFSSPEFIQAWDLWKKHLKEKKKPLGSSAEIFQLKKLGAMTEAHAIATIEHSISGNYQGLYEPSASTTKQQTPSRPAYTDPLPQF